jgi:hypothetical protein
MINFSAQAAMVVATAVAACVAVVVAFLAPARLWEFLVRLARFFPILAVLATIVICLYFQVKSNPADLVGTGLPQFFQPYYWCWIMIVILGLGGSAAVLWNSLAPLFGRIGKGGPLDEPWSALQARLAQARVDLFSQRVHLVVAPDRDGEGRTANLIRSAGPRVMTVAPAGPAPIHAHVLREGVVLSCDGTWPSGLHADGAYWMADLGKKLRARGPERPVITGITILIPIEWADRPESVDLAVVAGEEIQALYHSLKDRCPVIILFSGLETVPGAPEFIRRLAALDRRRVDARAGFDIPAATRFDRDLAHKAMDWIGSWFHCVVLDMMVADLFAYRSNAELVRFDYELRYRRSRLVDVMEAAFLAQPGEQETIAVRGGYFTAIGDEPGTGAFGPGLFYGIRSPILSNRRGADWTDLAIRQDAWYRWAAIGLALSTAAIAIVIWLLKIRPLEPIVGYVGLSTLFFFWVTVLVWPRRTQKVSEKPAEASL